MMNTKNMKGFIFTLDAVFALIVAAAGISILLYVHSVTNSAYSIPVSEATSILNSLLYSTPSSLYATSAVSNITVNGTLSYTWPQYGHYANLGSSTQYGPKSAYTLFTFDASSPVVQTVLADKGLVFVAAGNYIFALNYTNGKEVYTINAGSTIEGAPAIYENELLFANSTQYLIASNVYNGSKVWSSSIPVALAPGEPILIEDGYATFTSGTNFYIASTVNGSIIASSSVSAPYSAMPPVYANGEFMVAVNSSAQNYVYAFALAGSSLVKVWSAPISSSSGAITMPVVIGSRIIIGSGTSAYSLTDGGSVISSIGVGAPVKGIAYDGTNVYVETTSGIYAYNASSSTEVFGYATEAQSQNTAPSVASGMLYTLINGGAFQAYNISDNRMLWNVTLPSFSNTPFADIAIAYGNAYIASGTELYALGGYHIQPYTSLLQALGSLYLNGNGEAASMLLNTIYPSSDIGIFINNTYAPSLRVANLNGFGANVSIDTGHPLLTENETMAVWIRWNGGKHLAGSCCGSRQEILGADSALGYELNPIIAINDSGTGEAETWVCVTPACWTEAKSAANTIQPGTWYFLVSRYNGSYVSIWIDGVQYNYAAASGTLELQGSGDLAYIGSRSNTGSYFNGSVANAQIYNTSLSATQIQQLYQEGEFGAPAPNAYLVGWWPLNGNANDYSGHYYANLQNNVVYNYGNVLPFGLSNAYEVSKAGVPLGINVNGATHIYNVSVVLWR